MLSFVSRAPIILLVWHRLSPLWTFLRNTAHVYILYLAVTFEVLPPTRYKLGKNYRRLINKYGSNPDDPEAQKQLQQAKVHDLNIQGIPGKGAARAKLRGHELSPPLSWTWPHWGCPNDTWSFIVVFHRGPRQPHCWLVWKITRKIVNSRHVT